LVVVSGWAVAKAWAAPVCGSENAHHLPKGERGSSLPLSVSGLWIRGQRATSLLPRIISSAIKKRYVIHFLELSMRLLFSLWEIIKPSKVNGVTPRGRTVRKTSGDHPSASGPPLRAVYSKNRCTKILLCALAFSLVGAAEREKTTIIVALLGSPSRIRLWKETEALIDKGFKVIGNHNQP